MLLGMSGFTVLHVVLSLVALGSGLVVLVGLIQHKRLDGWTALFLATTVLTSVTGFGFPFDRFLPSHWTGVISLAVLAVALLARYVFRLAGPWRWIFVSTAMAAFYFNAFVLVVQLFRKVPALNVLAPTESEPPFAIAQGALLIAFVVLTVLAGKRFGREGGLPA
jgi:hypothetical protein